MKTFPPDVFELLKLVDRGEQIPDSLKALAVVCEHEGLIRYMRDDDGNWEYVTPGDSKSGVLLDITEFGIATLKLAPSFCPLDQLHDDARMTHVEIAEKLKLDGESVRKRLDRWRRKNAGADDWSEESERKGRQPKYRYRVGAIREVFRDLFE